MRARSAAFPFELAFRLIQMFSLQEDLVLDPFAGTGTTLIAALTAARNSIGVELDSEFWPFIREQMKSAPGALNETVFSRIREHNQFVKEYLSSKGPLKYTNKPHGFPVMTRQEIDIQLMAIAALEEKHDFKFETEHIPIGKGKEGRA